MNDIDTENFTYSSPLPYPKIRVHCKNHQYAKLILKDYAGIISELSAVTQYVYHSIYLSKEYPYISKVINKISIVEMHHLDILGKLLIELGVSPKYGSIKKNKFTYWSSKNIYYENSLKSMICADIKSEKDAIAIYNRNLSQIDDTYIKEIIERIIIDEEHHLRIFEDIYNYEFNN
ncbi:putative Mn-containing catalase [Clostridium bornimense]|uniref:Putative Mn-containing catalase n=1 Tax=Clostridium bornimense TaxID=1216932 RepID=W6SEZ9_9CLOT|nr:ferritin family protein [Clostridium bornimense]CDM68280.1 putative Mn-containing catalase [Clostridium bornimense]